ncbi:MAG: acyl-ACP--UDP-N-acetylglucosamine O-acyltransferase [Deltaproteobacteria bacterium]|nr:acyl-ACP--UDP-N-acetylglucosamine O-acyltransferase [Deltaproteobacteria bacterium]
MTTQIHATAIVASGAEIDKDVEIGPYSVIGPYVKLAARCKVGPHAVIEGRTEIGEETRVFQFASVGAQPQDLKFHDEPSRLVIGSHNMIREFVTLQPGTEHGGMLTTIGSHNLFMANSHVAHDCIVGDYNVFANSAALAGHVTIGNRIVVGGLVGIHQFVKVGDFAMLGGGAMVSRDVPPYCIAQGDHAELRGINIIALKRNKFSDEDILAIKKGFRHLFLHAGNFEDKVASLPDNVKTNAAIKTVIEFVQTSNRGVCRAAVTLDS